MRFPVVVGYLLGGCLIGPGALEIVGQEHHELEWLAEIGVFFLLFSIGLEITAAALAWLGRKLLIGGALQMTAVALPVGLLLLAVGLPGRSAYSRGLTPPRVQSAACGRASQDGALRHRPKRRFASRPSACRQRGARGRW